MLRTRFFGLAIIIAILLVYLFPLYWLFISTLKSKIDLYQYPPEFWPSNIDWKYLRVFAETNMGLRFLNSLILAGSSTLLVLLLSTGASYVLAKYNSRLVSFLLFFLAVMQTIPPPIMIGPLYLMYRPLHLLDTYSGVIIAMCAKGIPFSILLYKVGFEAIPKTLADAAKIDGCNQFTTLLRVYIPIAKNHLLVVSTLIFLQGMGEYIFSKSLLSSDAKLPATVILSSYVGPNATDWSSAMVFAFLYTLPILLVFIFVQKNLVHGLTAGASKG